MKKLKISENRRYIETADGKLFPWLADTAWTIPQRMKWDDVEYYMQKRKSQGFTVLQIVALDPERDEEMRNPSGDKALINNSLETPNESYFRYLDYVLDCAETYGFYVLLLPAWGELVTGDDWGGGIHPKTVTEENAYGYGRWIGNRYRERKNILWCLGGDRQPVHKGTDYRKLWRNMAEGLSEGLTGTRLKYNENPDLWKELLITYHSCYEMETGECSTMSYWDDGECWIGFIMLQSGHGLFSKNYELVEKEYTRERRMPVWDGEPAYEEMPTSWPPSDGAFHSSWMVRRRAYWSLLSGAFGFTYGHASMWCCISEKEKNAIARYTWYEALHSQGSSQMKYLREFMDAVGAGACIPCQNILMDQTMGGDTLETHVQAAETADGSCILVYFPAGGEENLDLRGFTKEQHDIYLWWWKPAEGRFYSESNKESSLPLIHRTEDGFLKVKSPDAGAEKDWLLFICRNNTGFPVATVEYYELSENEKAKKVFEW